MKTVKTNRFDDVDVDLEYEYRGYNYSVEHEGELFLIRTYARLRSKVMQKLNDNSLSFITKVTVSRQTTGRLSTGPARQALKAMRRP